MMMICQAFNNNKSSRVKLRLYRQILTPHLYRGYNIQNMTKQTANNDDNKAQPLDNKKDEAQTALDNIDNVTPQSKGVWKHPVQTHRLIDLANRVIYNYLMSNKVNMHKKADVANKIVSKSINTIEQQTGYKIIIIKDGTDNGIKTITANDYRGQNVLEGSSGDNRARLHSSQGPTDNKDGI